MILVFRCDGCGAIHAQDTETGEPVEIPSEVLMIFLAMEPQENKPPLGGFEL